MFYMTSSNLTLFSALSTGICDYMIVDSDQIKHYSIRLIRLTCILCPQGDPGPTGAAGAQGAPVS